MDKLELYFNYLNNSVYIKVVGHITFKNFLPFKILIENITKKFDNIDNFFIDFSECVYFDSSFIGTLVIIVREIMKKFKKKVTISIENKLMFILKTMGLLTLFNKVDKIENSDYFELKLNDYSDISKIEALILATHKNIIENNNNIDSLFIKYTN